MDGHPIVCSGSADHSARVWDMETGNSLTLALEATVLGVANGSARTIVVATELGLAAIQVKLPIAKAFEPP